MGKIEEQQFKPLIKEILDISSNRKKAADSMLKSTQAQIAANETKRDHLRESQVEAELAGDQKTADKCKIQIHELKQEIEELNEKCTAYQTAANRGNYATKVEKLRGLCPLVSQERAETSGKIREEITRKKDQVNKITKELEELGNQVRIINSERLEAVLLPIIDLIDPRCKTLGSSDRERFLSIWLGYRAGNLDDLFIHPAQREPGTYPLPTRIDVEGPTPQHIDRSNKEPTLIEASPIFVGGKAL
jgi:hypothetical protein